MREKSQWDGMSISDIERALKSDSRSPVETDGEILPASDAIVRVRAAQRGLPGVLAKACECAYCETHVQYLDGRFHEVATGRLHTCPNEVAQRLRRRYAAGMFEWLDAPAITALLDGRTTTNG